MAGAAGAGRAMAVWPIRCGRSPGPISDFAPLRCKCSAGVIAMTAMSIAMVLAARPRWLEPHLAGMDKMYRLHKWLGITALVSGLAPTGGWPRAPSGWSAGAGSRARRAARASPSPTRCRTGCKASGTWPSNWANGRSMVPRCSSPLPCSSACPTAGLPRPTSCWPWPTACWCCTRWCCSNSNTGTSPWACGWR